MRFFDYIRMALKNLRRQRLRSALTIIAVVIGTVFMAIMLTIVMSVKTAVKSHMESMGELTEVTVRPSMELAEKHGIIMQEPGEENRLDDTAVDQVREIPNVLAASPIVQVCAAQSIKLEGSEKEYWANLFAIEPQPGLEEKLVAGRQLQEGEMGEVLISTDTMKAFGYEDDPEGLIGKNVILIGGEGVDMDVVEPPVVIEGGTPPIEQQMLEVEHPEYSAEVIGISSRMGSDRNLISMAWAREIETNRHWEPTGPYGQPELHQDCMIDERGYNAIILKVNNTDNVERVAATVEDLGYGARTAQDFLDDLNKGLAILGMALGAIGLISMVVAAIGIINTMVMATYERTREIGVMRACGARRRTVQRLFKVEAAFIGFLGGIIGIAITFLLAIAGNYVARSILEGQDIVVGSIISIPLWLVFGIIGLTTLIAFLAGAYPARRAARMDPVEALRYE